MRTIDTLPGIRRTEVANRHDPAATTTNISLLTAVVEDNRPVPQDEIKIFHRASKHLQYNRRFFPIPPSFVTLSGIVYHA
ncbi:hypothetical protein GCM10023157_36350 [Gluconacetobacter asukensis]